MTQEREVCICFHVSYRKLANFVRLRRPKFPSQMSECFGAGTGCGWCRPVLKKIFEQSQPDSLILPQKIEDTTARADEHSPIDWENLSTEQYLERRANYIRQRKGKDPGTDQSSEMPEK